MTHRLHLGHLPVTGQDADSFSSLVGLRKRPVGS